MRDDPRCIAPLVLLPAFPMEILAADTMCCMAAGPR